MTAPLRWYDLDNSEARPTQWYYQNAPCELLRWGLRKGEKSPAAQEVRTADGKTHTVWRDGKGGYPGLSYELFQHAPGRA